MPALGGGPGRKAGRRWQTLTEEGTGWGKAGALSRRRAAAGQAGPALPLPRRRAGAVRPGLSRGPRDTVPRPGAAAATSLPSRRQPAPASPSSAGRSAAPRPVTWRRGTAAAAPCPVSFPPALHSPDAPAQRRGSAPSRPRPRLASITAAEAPPPPPHGPPRPRLPHGRARRPGGGSGLLSAAGGERGPGGNAQPFPARQALSPRRL